MRVLPIAVSSLSLALAALPCVAAGTNGNQLLENCQAVINWQDGGRPSGSMEQGFRAGHCVGMIMGFLEGQAAVAGVRDVKKLTCPPEEAELGQLARVLLKYLKEHPEQLDKSEGLLVMMALVSAFPCK